MYWGVPTTVLAPVSCDFSIDLELFDQAEVEQLHDVTLAPLRAQHDVGRLDVAMDQADGMGFGQRSANHRQDPHHSACRLRAVDRDDPLQGRAVEELHRVVEDAVVGSPVVEDGDGVGVGQTRGQLDFALETTEVDLAGPIGPQQLDRRGAPHHAVAGPVDLPHSPFADLPLEHVLAEPARLADLGPEAVDDPRDDGARDDGEAPHHGGGCRQPGIGARVERAPGEPAIGDRYQEGRHQDHRDAEQGGDDDGATRRRRDQGGANGDHHRHSAQLQHRHVAVGHHDALARSRANDRGRTRPRGSAPAGR